MRASQKHHHFGGFSNFYQQPAHGIESYPVSNFQIIDSKPSGHSVVNMSFRSSDEQFFTLESSPPSAVYDSCDSPTLASSAFNKSSFSQSSPSCVSELHHSPDNTYGSLISSSSVSDDNKEFSHKLRELECLLLGSESEYVDNSFCSFDERADFSYSLPKQNPVIEMIPKLDMRQLLIACAQAVSGSDFPTAAALVEALEQKVSVFGEPIQRLGAYMLEGLKARMQSSGYTIYKSLKCDEPTSSELMSSMHTLYQICPYWKFAYVSANAVIAEAVTNESRIHIIDFQIAQGSQWEPLIQSLAHRCGGPPSLCITGIDDSLSTHARGGGLHIVGQRLTQIAGSCNVPFEFHDAAMSNYEVRVENLRIQPGEALVVNLPYVLHHIPDESVSTENHRDQLLRFIKSLSPKVVTLVEQESNTNTAAFFTRFVETLDYYTAMFESINVAQESSEKEKIKAEQRCVARDIVNMVACEGAERVERHEPFGKWWSRFTMAGFTPYPLSPSATNAVQEMLKEYHENYKLAELKGVLCMGWLNRAMFTSSAWL